MPPSVMPTSNSADVLRSPAAVSAIGLRKSYGDRTVLDGIDLRVPAGSVFALLGPNGAGKTTAVKILSTLVSADGGQAQVAGHNLATDPQAARASIGVTGQFSAVDGLITGEENMLLMADLHRLPKTEGRRVAAELLERFDLTDAAKKPASAYSGGMKRRLDIAMTLVGDPRIIFLDEPTTGHPRPPRHRRHPGRRTHRPHPRPRRRLLRPHRPRYRPHPDQGGGPMSAFTLSVRDSHTMLRRNLLHARRYPSLTLNLLLTPVMLLLLFVYVFGDVMSAGLGGGGADRDEYIAYLVPGILLMTVGSTVVGTAVSVSTDMNEGIIARFRTMAIRRESVLVGHVLGSVLQCVMSVVLVGVVSVAIGFRATEATALEWVAAFGLLTLFALALTWIAVGMGLSSPNAEAASNNALPMIFLPLISSTFVPIDAMPGWFQPIAEYQPFTPAIETLRGLLLGSEIGHNGWLALAWCLGLAVLGHLWSTSLFGRDPE